MFQVFNVGIDKKIICLAITRVDAWSIESIEGFLIKMNSLEPLVSTASENL